MKESAESKIVNLLIQNGNICAEDVELYTYGIKQGFILLLNIITTIIIGVIFESPLESIIFLVSYIPIRTYAGGFHATTQTRCYFFSIVMVVLILLFIKVILDASLVIFLGLLILSGITIWLLAPVEDNNKPLDNLEVYHYKKRARIFLVIEAVLFIVFYYFNCKVISTTILVGLVASSIMLILGMLKNKIARV